MHIIRQELTFQRESVIFFLDESTPIISAYKHILIFLWYILFVAVKK